MQIIESTKTYALVNFRSNVILRSQTVHKAKQVNVKDKEHTEILANTIRKIKTKINTLQLVFKHVERWISIKIAFDKHNIIFGSLPLLPTGSRLNLFYKWIHAAILKDKNRFAYKNLITYLSCHILQKLFATFNKNLDFF